MPIASIALACLLVSANAGADMRVVVAIDALGIRGPQLTQMHEHLRAEGAAIGATLSTFHIGAQPERACFDDPACVRRAIAGLDVQAVLHLQLLRVGGTVQLVARSYHTSGHFLEEATLEASAAGFPGSIELQSSLAELLGGPFDAAEPEPKARPAPASTGEPLRGSEASLTPRDPGVTSPPPVPARRFPWTPVILAASGGALALTGTVMAASQDGVVNDPNSTDRSKERAHTVGRLGWGGIGIGAALAVTGLVMLGLELLED